MKRRMVTGLAACAVVMGLAPVLAVPPELDAGPERPAWSQGLAAAIEEGIRLLDEHRMVPDEAQAQAALLEALIRVAEPSVEFLDDEGLAAREQRRSRREWEIGLTVVETEDLPKVAAVTKKSPAAAAGILPGESIEKIGGRSLFSYDGVMFVREWLLDGEEADIEIEVRAADGTSRMVTVERVRRSESSLAHVEELPADMGYIRVDGIYPGVGGEIAAALEKWQATDIFGAILDLRGVSGTAAEEIPILAGRFAPAGSVLYIQSDRQGRDLQTVKAPAAPVETLPLMVLVDENTSTAAELLAAVLAGSAKGAMLIGRETSGDPMIREPLRLSTGRHALLATRQVRMANGKVYSGGGGVRPDVFITDAALNETVYEPETLVSRRGRTVTDEEKIDQALRDRTRNDTYLRRATDVLLGLQALGYDRLR